MQNVKKNGFFIMIIFVFIALIAVQIAHFLAPRRIACANPAREQIVKNVDFPIKTQIESRDFLSETCVENNDFLAENYVENCVFSLKKCNKNRNEKVDFSYKNSGGFLVESGVENNNFLYKNHAENRVKNYNFLAENSVEKRVFARKKFAENSSEICYAASIYDVITPEVVAFYEREISLKKVLSNKSQKQLERIASRYEISVPKAKGAIIAYDFAKLTGDDTDFPTIASMSDLQMLAFVKARGEVYSSSLTPERKEEIKQKASDELGIKL